MVIIKTFIKWLLMNREGFFSILAIADFVLRLQIIDTLSNFTPMTGIGKQYTKNSTCIYCTFPPLLCIIPTSSKKNEKVCRIGLACHTAGWAFFSERNVKFSLRHYVVRTNVRAYFYTVHICTKSKKKRPPSHPLAF